MKRSKILMGTAFVLALSASLAFKAAPKDSVFTTRYHVVSNVCTSFSTSDCDGSSSHTACTGVYSSIDEFGTCNGTTYKTI